jgi:hypothetical protein
LSFRSIKIRDNLGLKHFIDSNVVMGEMTENEYQITGLDDPVSVSANCKRNLRLDFNDSNIQTQVKTDSKMTCDLDNFYLMDKMQVMLNGQEFFTKQRTNVVPRRFV